MFPLRNNAQGPPSPGYYPSSRIGSIGFNQGFRNLWGPQHQKLDQGALTIWLDRSSGSGFKSLNPYSSGYFGAAIKLQSGYTAGVITSLYVRKIHILFFVDDVPIRRYPRKSDDTFPMRPMWVYGSIWDASSWATENGKYKADYNYQPFVGKYNNFKISGCNANGAASCRPASGSPSDSSGLSRQQYTSMAWVQRNYKVYDYCGDPQRNHKLTPEC
ncbi:hypothetical protein DH2020_021151 [Rehmannia glutinosa]|uniref:Xyloglucan endotransglucosylase/hydrolase n=1 Tax=Rehmannia glutinosa TaxID=99300 RepID=A0ABR0WCK4_REHGL